MTLELIALDKHWVREIKTEGTASLEASCSNFGEVVPFLKSAVDAHATLFEKTGASAPWIAYLARLQQTRAFVGICSFTDDCRGGQVEIAYFAFPPYERRGHGTAMARQLVDLALRHPDVSEIVAFTLPEDNASTRILRRLEFEFEGEVDDPEDGKVWRWSLHRGTQRVSHDARASMARKMATFTLMMRTAL